MKEQKPFKKYYNRLAKEGILKSLLVGIALAWLVSVSYTPRTLPTT